MKNVHTCTINRSVDIVSPDSLLTVEFEPATKRLPDPGKLFPGDFDGDILLDVCFLRAILQVLQFKIVHYHY